MLDMIASSVRKGPLMAAILSPFRMAFCVSLLLLLHFSATSQQNQSATDSPRGVVKSSTRLVVVDVVATDSKGRPVLGLKAEDFIVTEDGQPQRISDFSFQQPGVIPVETAVLPLNVVTNVPRFKATSLNVILLDAINGEFTSHAYAQDRLIKFLESNPTVQPTAIYALETKKLTLLHDFTTDTAALKKTLADYRPYGTARMSQVDLAASPFVSRGAFHTDEHTIESTLRGLNSLAQILSGYPGRKNLIWVSEAFPTSLMAEGAPQSGLNLTSAMFSHSTPKTPSSDPSANIARAQQAEAQQAQVQGSSPEDVMPGAGHNFIEELARIANALMNAHVALYPIDSAGLGQADHLSSQNNMKYLAERTGGKSFYNSNNVELGVRSSIDDGSTYYSLTYYPQNKNWNGAFRNIQITTSRPGVQLRYRLGYYALDPDKAANKDIKKVVQDVGMAMSSDTPTTSAVLFQATVVPSKGDGKVTVNFLIDPHSLVFEQREDGLAHAAVACAVFAYPDKGKPVINEGTSSVVALRPEKLLQAMQSRFPCSQTINLKSGHYTLRLGVVDRNTNLIGTAIIQTTVP
jgi:VWFA-related protein